MGLSPGFIGPCCHGKDEAKVYKQLCRIVEEWVDIYEKEKLPLPEVSKAIAAKSDASLTRYHPPVRVSHNSKMVVTP